MKSPLASADASRVDASRAGVPRPDAPRIDHVLCVHPGGLHRMAYREWSPASEERGTVLCVHGLTRTGGDFDRLAATLAGEGWRVVCPDIAGRGLSDRLPSAELYDIPQYVADCATLLARLDRPAIDWVGTSMGGLVGMAFASLAGHPIRRLLVNDIGPVVARAGLARIAGYVGGDARYPDFASAEAALRRTMASFGPHTDEEFRLLSRHHFVEKGGEWVSHLDPLVARAFEHPPDEDMRLWPLWEAIDCPVTVIRGEASDLLDAATATLMTRGGPSGTGPRARLETLAGVGHAPTLIRSEQIDLVRRFLEG